MRLSGRELALQPGWLFTGAASAAILHALVAPCLPRSERGVPPAAVMLSCSEYSLPPTPFRSRSMRRTLYFSPTAVVATPRCQFHRQAPQWMIFHHLVESGPIESQWILISRPSNLTLPSSGAMSALSLPAVAAGLNSDPQAWMKEISFRIPFLFFICHYRFRDLLCLLSLHCLHCLHLVLLRLPLALPQ